MQLRQANIDDIDFILSQERRDEYATFITLWSRDEHNKNITNPDKRYFIIENESGQPSGYVILSGLQSLNRSIELTRIVVTKPGSGYGKRVLPILIKMIFDEYKAHRLWLDVFEHNQRARYVYQTCGFKEEGVLREAVKQGDNYSSLVIMSILESEYYTANT
ncbi:MULTISPECIES: GNAT family N-acetyltransferase [Nostocales]|uniref:GCN5 family acetyltransferase n=3 Tax=Nostocales TaxID=1161 RepID=A0A0C1N8A6_9CYAN|nr:GNAT family protein [Tolypothrix bouteillei]KAF3885536.1 GNAT family N-acetyltransferase [Tolypothrix bouteillei VB521301]